MGQGGGNALAGFYTVFNKALVLVFVRHESELDKVPDAVKKGMIEGSYLKRMAQPTDIAKAILFLASEDADFITGQMLLVDGGFSLKAG